MRLTVCIVGQNASLKFGGEASLPWWCFKFLRLHGVDAHLLVHARTRPEVEAGFPNDLDRIHFAPETRIDRFLWRLGSFLPMRLDVLTFGVMRHIHNQRLQKKILRKLIQEKGIQIVHEIDPVSPRQVSLMHDLGVPVVIGPLAGAMSFPPAFSDMETRGAVAINRFGQILSRVLNVFMPGKTKAQGLIVANEASRNALPKGTTGKIFHMPDVGVDLSIWASQEDRPPRNDGLVKFCYLGRLIPLKGVQFMLDAFASVVKSEPSARLEILGDGSMKKELENRASQLGVSDKVDFAGWVNADEGARRLRQSDVMIFPTLREVGGIVILEAMAVGLPIIATNWGGPAQHITDDTGISVNPDSREAFVKGLADAMLKMIHEPQLRSRMSVAAKKRVRSNLYDWNERADRLIEIYQELIGKHKE